MKSLFETTGGTYTKVGDYYVPDLKLADEAFPDDVPLGKYGLLWSSTIKPHTLVNNERDKEMYKDGNKVHEGI